MKKNHFSLMVLALVALMFSTFCAESHAQEEKIKVPCTEMKSIKGFLRGWGTATSSKAMIARKKARIAAMTELVSSLETSLESVTEDYTTEVGTDMDVESKSFFSDKVKASAKRVLKGAVPVCDEWARDKNTGKFVSYVVVEIPTGDFSKAVAKDVVKSMSGENNSGPKVDAEKLEEMFNKEFYKK